MKELNKNYEYYQSTFKVLHSSDNLRKKVLNIPAENTKPKSYKLRKAVCIVVAVVLLLIATNAVTLAVTGEIWVMQGYNSVVQGTDNHKIYGYRAEDDIQNEEYDEPTIEITIDNTEEKYNNHKNYGEKLKITNEGDRVYLEWDLYAMKKDITQYLTNGRASLLLNLQDCNGVVHKKEVEIYRINAGWQFVFKEGDYKNIYYSFDE